MEKVMPKRIQRQRTRGWKMPPNTVYVGRPTVFGNPWTCKGPYGCPHSPQYDHGHRADGTPEMSCCVDTFREWCRQGIAGEESRLVGKGGGFLAVMMAVEGNQERSAIVDAIPSLRGKNLACWCRLDQACHADVLLELANG